MNTENVLPTVKPRRTSTAWCAIAFEELEETIDLIDMAIDDITPMQRKVWERYKKQTVAFARDMLLAEGDKNEIARRLNLRIGSQQ